MLPKPERLVYHGNPADLLLLIDEKLAFARRDADAFAPRGWPETRFVALEQAGRALRQLPTDEELAQALRKAEQKRTDARTALTTAIQTVLGKARQVYHPESAEYRGYGAARLHQTTDVGFALLAEQVAAVGLDALATSPDEIKIAYQQAGLTAAELTAIEQGTTAYRQRLLAVAFAETRRAVGTQHRIQAANSVYRSLAALCELGKSLFIATDPARYTDYLLLPAAPAAPDNKRGRPRKAPVEGA